VVCAASAEVAVDILNQRSDIDLVFSDSRDARHERPRARPPDPGTSSGDAGGACLGYSDRAAAAIAEGFTLLQKPYSLERVAKIIG